VFSTAVGNTSWRIVNRAIKPEIARTHIRRFAAVGLYKNQRATVERDADML
jgi:hypothetical protein